MPDELVNTITQEIFHFDPPNLWDICSMALSRMILHIFVNIYLLVKDIISVSCAR